jgi:hypothetical protein
MHKVASSLLILLGAVSAQATSIQITALPYTIVTPGTYVLAADLGNPTPTTDITINVNVPGKVLLNLNGHKLLPYLHNNQPIPAVDAIDVLAGEDIYIENGTIGTLAFGFLASINVNPNATSFLSNLEIYEVLFGGCVTWNIIFNRVNSSVVKNCNFAGQNGITDIDSLTGNKFLNNVFEAIGVGFSVTSHRTTAFDWKPSAQ